MSDTAAPPAKRQRHVTPHYFLLSSPSASSSSSSNNNGGDAALRVVTNSQLLRLISPWAVGWPYRVVQRWRAFQAERATHNAVRAQRGLPLSTAREVEVFMRELLQRGELAMLKLVVTCEWDRHSGKSKPFEVKDLQFAIRSQDAATLRWAFEFTGLRADSHDKVRWYWQEALTRFQGHCDVLEVLKEFARPFHDLWAYDFDAIRSVPVAQWIVEQLGAAYLPPRLIARAARDANLPLVEYLATVRGQDVALVVSVAVEFAAEIARFLGTLA